MPNNDKQKKQKTKSASFADLMKLREGLPAHKPDKKPTKKSLSEGGVQPASSAASNSKSASEKVSVDKPVKAKLQTSQKDKPAKIIRPAGGQDRRKKPPINPPGSNGSGGGGKRSVANKAPTNAGHYYYVKGIGANRDFGRKLPVYTINELLGLNSNSAPKIHLHGLDYKDWFHIPGSRSFKLRSVYPGMLLGVGYLHPVPEKKDKNAPASESDFQSGFFFDWTTGLPLIPGSTVKGLLRSVFPRDGKVQEEINRGKAEYILGCLEGIEAPGDAVTFAKALRQSLFFDRGLIFHDAYIAGLAGKDRIFAEDYITPHKDNPFGDPTPLRFLKIAPNVTFCFQFTLKPVTVEMQNENETMEIPENVIESLFKNILTDFGAGAKRNTGYGVLEECA